MYGGREGPVVAKKITGNSRLFKAVCLEIILFLFHQVGREI